MEIDKTYEEVLASLQDSLTSKKGKETSEWKTISEWAELWGVPYGRASDTIRQLVQVQKMKVSRDTRPRVDGLNKTVSVFLLVGVKNENGQDKGKKIQAKVRQPSPESRRGLRSPANAPKRNPNKQKAKRA